MEAPDKIYINGYSAFATVPVKNGIEYIRKDISDETIKTAEDHAYFAGQERFREKLLEWAKAINKMQTAPIQFVAQLLIDKIESI
jgi:hypothetical protein